MFLEGGTPLCPESIPHEAVVIFISCKEIPTTFGESHRSYAA